jgi:hypothetical protein
MRNIRRYSGRTYPQRHGFRYAGRSRRRNLFDPSRLTSFRRNGGFASSAMGPVDEEQFEKVEDTEDCTSCGVTQWHGDQITYNDEGEVTCRACWLNRSPRGRRRNLDPTRLTAFRRNVEPEDIDPSRLLAFGRRRNLFDPSRLTSFRRRRNLDPTRLTAFRHNIEPEDIDPARLIAFRRHNSIDPTRLTAFRRNPGYRRNPDPDGKPWGPQLYNPLQDNNRKFKNEGHYKKMIAKLRRNPW